MSDGYAGLLAMSGRKVWDEELRGRLEAPFDAVDIACNKKGLTYPKPEAVKARLDEVFEGCWSTLVKKDQLVGNQTPTVMATVTLVIHHPEYMGRVVENFGGRAITKGVDTPDDFKSAVTLGLRKCALEIGVGACYRGDIDVDTESAAAPATPAATAAAKPAAAATTNTDDVDGPDDASGNQRSFIRTLLDKAGTDLSSLGDGFQEKFGKDIPSNEAGFKKGDKAAASWVIEQLKKVKPAAKPAATPAPAPATKDAKQPEKGKATTKAKDEKPAKAAKAEPTAAAEKSDGRTKALEDLIEKIASTVQKDKSDPSVLEVLVHMHNRSKKGKPVEGVGQLTQDDLELLLESLQD